MLPAPPARCLATGARLRREEPVADYFAVLSRAVAGLEDNSAASRGELYARARALLVKQLRSGDPPWPRERVEAELASFEAAIERIESDARRPSGRIAAAAPPRTASAPQRQATPAANAAPAQTPPSSKRSPLTTTLAAAIGAVLLAVIVAGGYAYLSRPAANTPAVAVQTGAAPTHAGQAAAPDNRAAEPADSMLPYVLRRQLVYYRSSYAPGTIVVIKSQHMLYQVKAATVAIRYSIAVGPKCLEAAGLHRVSRKDGAQTATAASQKPAPPASGPAGGRVLHFTDVDDGIQGTRDASLIGDDSDFGCILLAYDDIGDLYDRTPIDTRVIIIN